jgi:hypothetical protein
VRPLGDEPLEVCRCDDGIVLWVAEPFVLSGGGWSRVLKHRMSSQAMCAIRDSNPEPAD